MAEPEAERRIQAAVREARRHLESVAPTAPKRRLDLALELFRRTAHAWGEPDDVQLAHIRDHIAEVLELVHPAPRVLGLRRSA